ncbi:hypothetical protein ACNVED_00250 [Legionella sp. D16C41]|uniref:hypothetical protein n=1 Tax=Legionella sp. D16C41 TaxID=3402688 RepID=UPI003AF69B39
MPKLFRPLLEDNKSSQGIHYYLSHSSFGTGEEEYSDRWATIYKKKLTIFYDIADISMLNNGGRYGVFHSGFKWNILDEELNKVEIIPKEHLALEITLLIKKTPDTNLAVQIMTYPKVEAAGALLVLAGILAWTSALITLIPPVAAAIAVSSATIALVGGIILAIGLTMALVSRYCEKRLDNAPLKENFLDLTVEQLNEPSSQKSFSAQAKKALLPSFFQEKATASGVTEKAADENLPTSPVL